MDRAKKLNFLADVAEAVLVEGLTQQEAAERFDLSRPSISRLLAEAREEGIVQIEILRRLSENSELANRIVQQFGIDKAHVANVGKIRNIGTNDQFVRFAADRIATLFAPGVLVGVTLGTTLGFIIHRLAKLQTQQITVVQLCGSIGAGNPLLDSHALVSHLAHSYGANCLHLHAPYAVESEQVRDSLNRNVSNKLCLDYARKVEIALVGMGTIALPQSSLQLGGHVDEMTVQAFQRNGAVGDVSGYYIDRNGDSVELENSHFWRTGLTSADFRKIPRRIGIATGVHKAGIIAASLAGGWITELATDQETAEQVLKEL